MRRKLWWFVLLSKMKTPFPVTTPGRKPCRIASKTMLGDRCKSTELSLRGKYRRNAALSMPCQSQLHPDEEIEPQSLYVQYENARVCFYEGPASWSKRSPALRLAQPWAFDSFGNVPLAAQRSINGCIAARSSGVSISISVAVRMK
jgi:hypothetical protein